MTQTSSVAKLSREEVFATFGSEITPLIIDKSAQETESNGRGGNASTNDASLFEGHDEQQIKLMEEVCIVLDWDDKPIASGSKKVCHLMDNIQRGLLHRAFSVFLFNSDNKLLLQKRADEKITFPSMWTNTCCSHPLAIPSELGYDLESAIAGVKRAAQRKLDQELGIAIKDIPFEDFNFLTRIHYVAPSNGVWGEHEIDYILIIKADPKVTANPNEVGDDRYVSAEELKAMFQDPKLKFTPWFKLICESYLFKWWESLDDVSKFQDNELHRML